ncbi:PrgI family protein [Spongiactinospora sp. TRM90649]|uniref:PrgI family protein n=1 Tax=Spongiactinospora sp. TRM90649 TaxID=3031114 RepID=UPI0023F953A5|nr:PrgI family protein [Spongiactinospora sp. TRM90649]MDF5758800.1 PrgI family protein [Spongiactinospora sp. TRM90649]
MNDPLIARIPSDVDQPDRIAFGLTVRQLAVIAATGAVAAGLYYAFHKLLPVVVLAGLLLPPVAAGVAVALGRRDGLTLDRFALAALLFARSPKRLVAAPVVAPPRWCRVRGKLPAPLRLPVRAGRADGVLELAEGGVAVLVEASTLSFHLRTADEQASLVGAFGRWLNSLEAPVQILVRTRPVDLSPLIAGVERQADTLPHPALAQAAAEHAAFLTELAQSADLLSRQVLIVLREQAAGRRAVRRDAAAPVVLRRAAETARALGALGVHVRVLDVEQARQALTECLDPGGWHPAGTDELISAREA